MALHPLYFGKAQALTHVVVLSIKYGVHPLQLGQKKLPRVSLTAVTLAYFVVAAGYPKLELLSLKSRVFGRLENWLELVKVTYSSVMAALPSMPLIM
jgi:hypothetical protein